MSPRSPQRSRPARPHGNTMQTARQFGVTTMSFQNLSVGGVAAIVAHLLLIGASLLLQGFALKQRTSSARLGGMAGALIFAVAALLLADDWPERLGLVFSAMFFAPL